MKKEILNGTPIPYESSIDELKQLLSSPAMKDFSLACEVLSYHKTREAYELMKSFLNDKDKYRRLYILKTIFRHSEAVELVDYLESAISSEDFLFVENGLIAVSEYKIKISETLLLSAVKKHFDKLYTAINALKTLNVCEHNYNELMNLLRNSNVCVQKELLCEIIAEGYLPLKAKELFDLCRYDKFAKIRLYAVQLGKAYGFDISEFSTDVDGHVRKAVEI